MTRTEKVHLTEEKATMLATLYGRAVDNESDDPLLGDRTASEVVKKIDYDWRSLGMNRDLSMSAALRAKRIDDWARQAIAAHPDAAVLHLGCGLDSRVYRVDPPADMPWFDVDYPEVIELRRRLYPEREGYHMIGSSVTDPAWLDRVPDGPAVIIAEGLTMYLPEREGVALLRRLTERFSTGEMIFDVYGRLGIRAQKVNPVIRRTGSTLHWGIDDPHALERQVPGLRLTGSLNAADMMDRDAMRRFSPLMRLQVRLLSLIPPLARVGQILRYRF